MDSPVSLNTAAFWLLAQIPGGPNAGPQEPPPLPFPKIPPPPPVEDDVPFWIVLIGLVIVLGAFYLVIKLMFGQRSKAAPPARRPLQTALRALRELRSKVDILPPSEVGHGVSEVLRTYYLHRYSVPAPYRTTEELFPMVADVSESSRRRQWREKFEPLAADYDTLAYAPVPASKQDAIELLEKAVKRLEDEIGSQGEEGVA